MLMIDELIENIKNKNTPLCVGLDTTLDILPPELLEEEFKEKWFTQKAYTSALFNFNKKIIDIVKSLVPAVSINIGCYEKYGVAGIKSFINTINYAKASGLIVIGDIKRAEYIESMLGKLIINKTHQSDYNADFITTNPYLGFNEIRKYATDCENYNKGMFVIVQTGVGDFHDLIVEDPAKPGIRKQLYYNIADRISEISQDYKGNNNFSLIGIVIPPVHSSILSSLRTIHPSMFFLIPDIGSLNIPVEISSLIPAFRATDKLGALIVKSNRILSAYKNPSYIGLSFEVAIQNETNKIITEINQYL